MDPVALSAALLDAARTDGPVDATPLLSVDPGALDPAARKAFWLNVYNARVKSAIRERGMTGNLRAYRGFFRATGWAVGGRAITLHEIEHGLLRGNRAAPWTFWRPLRSRDPRLGWGLPLDPRVHFALNCGAHSCPPIRAYTADRIDQQLDLATRSYLDGEVAIEDGQLRLPYLCRLYARDFPDARGFAARYLDPERAEWIRSHPEAKVRWGEYRWEIG